MRVLHVIDSLEPGGAEHVVLSLVNSLPRDRCNVFLCTTRERGRLADEVEADVPFLELGRRRSVDAAAYWRLRSFIKANRIDLVHAHGTALFLVQLVRWFLGTRLLWHEHCGWEPLDKSYRLPLFVACRGIDAAIAVNQPLAAWMHDRLLIPKERVHFVPNFVRCEAVARGGALDSIPGREGNRIACVANLRTPKDHKTLVMAMRKVVDKRPEATLLLVGSGKDQKYRDGLMSTIRAQRLERSVHLLGHVERPYDVLCGVDVGVLSSTSEGLPISLLEYGVVGLPVVVSDVGECAAVLDGGRAGVLVRPGDAAAMAEGLLRILESPDVAREYGLRLRERVRAYYSLEAAIDRIMEIYERQAHTRHGAATRTA